MTSGFNNSVLQTNEFPVQAVSNEAKFVDDGKGNTVEAGLYVFGVEETLWDKKLAAERQATAYRDQVQSLTVRRQQYDIVARDSQLKDEDVYALKEATRIERLGDLYGAAEIRARINGHAPSPYLTGGL